MPRTSHTRARHDGEEPKPEAALPAAEEQAGTNGGSGETHAEAAAASAAEEPAATASSNGAGATEEPRQAEAAPAVQERRSERLTGEHARAERPHERHGDRPSGEHRPIRDDRQTGEQRAMQRDQTAPVSARPCSATVARRSTSARSRR